MFDFIKVSLSGSNSVVECDLAKVEVAGSNPVSRSIILRPLKNVSRYKRDSSSRKAKILTGGIH